MESEIGFKIKAFTEFNQSIKLIGSIPELGQWSPTQALSLYTSERDYPIWSNLHLLRIPCGSPSSPPISIEPFRSEVRVQVRGFREQQSEILGVIARQL